jgi:hypothetical protein
MEKGKVTKKVEVSSHCFVLLYRSESLGFWTLSIARNSEYWKTTFRKLDLFRRIPLSEMLRRVALVKTEVSEKRMTSFIKVTKFGVLGRT